MATTANLSSIIRIYAEKQKSPYIDFIEFCAYLKKYSERHIEDSPDLVKYLAEPSDTVTAELQGLALKGIATLSIMNKKRVIISISYCSTVYANKFKDIAANDAIPYPTVNDLPKNFPVDTLEEKNVFDYLQDALGEQDLTSTALYALQFTNELPMVLMPACVPVATVIESAKTKIRKLLLKDENHDYYLKKLRDSNSGKAVLLQTFFENFVQNKNQPTDVHQTLAGDDYYYWGQLCYYLRQDFEKILDKSADDNNILQAIEFTEAHSVYLKQKMQQEQRRAEALKELALNLNKPPYLYTMDQIIKFKDQSGRNLYGLFDEDDLTEFIKKETAETDGKELPKLLTFKVASGTKYYVYKSKVIPIIVRLCNEAHNSVEKTLEEKWFDHLLNFDKLSEMSNPRDFEERLKREVEEKSPVLWAILNSTFITLLSYEKNDDELFDAGRIYNGNELLPYSDLLMLKASDIMGQARLRLPFYYFMPLISWILALFTRSRKSKIAAAKKEAASKNSGETANNNEEGESGQKSRQRSKKDALASQAENLMRELIPEGSSIDRELDFLCKQWNRMIGREARINLTEDVNSLIRDYMRRVINTITTSTFTIDRVKSLANTLVKTPNMQKIRDQTPLTEYVELYILKLISNK